MSVFYFVTAYLHAFSFGCVFVVHSFLGNQTDFLHLEQKYPLRYHHKVLSIAQTVTWTRESSVRSKCFQEKSGHTFMKDKPFYGSEKELFTCMVFNYVQLEERFIQQLSFRFWLLGLQPVSWRASLNKACWQVPIHPVCSYSNMALTNLTPNVFFFFFFKRHSCSKQ